MNKKIFLLVLIPALVLIGAYVFVRYALTRGNAAPGENIAKEAKSSDSSLTESSALDLRPLFTKRLQELVSKSSNDVYALSFGDMKIDVLASTASFQNVVLKPDQKRADSLNKIGMAPNETFSFSFEKLDVEGVNFDDAINSKKMDYNSVKLINPVLDIYRKANAPNMPANKEDFTQRFLKEMEKLSVKNLVVEGGKINIHYKGKTTTLKDVSINMKDILVDADTRTDASRFFFAKRASLGFKGYTTRTANGQYNLAIEKVNIEAPQQTLTLSGFSLAPPLTKQQFASRQKFAKEYFKVSFPSVTLTGVDWWNLLNEEEVVAKEISIPGGDVSIYLDRSKPAASKMGNFPAQLLMKLPWKIDVDRMTTNNLDLSYEEFNPVSQQSGTIFIKDIALNIANLSNNKVRAAKPVTVNGNALLMGKVPVQGDFVFSVQDYKSGKFTARINSDKAFNGELVNSFAMPMGMVKIEKGTLQEIHANISGDQTAASGDVKILYQDLKLQLLEKDKGEKALDKKGVTTFLANAFVLKKDNPRTGDAVRTAKADFKRIPEGGFFMLVWKTIMTGALKTVGAPARIANKRAGA